MTERVRRQVDPKTSPLATNRPWQGLVVAAALMIVAYAAIAMLSWQFGFDDPGTERPILAVLALLAFVFGVYVLSIRYAWFARRDRRTVKLIVGTGIVFRVIMWCSLPIQEVDIYRYLWDGAVTSAGVSPFAYSPAQVQQAHLHSTDDPVLRRLVVQLDQEPALAEVLQHVHYAELPTIYPATSQAVFAATHLLTPSQSSLLARVFLMKAWLIGFDIATLWAVIGILRLCGRPDALCILYAWCPLLMKEVANSGHLDAIAVFLTTVVVYLAVRLITRTRDGASPHYHTSLYLAGMAALLAFAVGAKLYPVVLAPLLFFLVVRRFGGLHLPLPVAVFTGLTGLLFWPMLPHAPTTAVAGNVMTQSSTVTVDLRPPVQVDSSVAPPVNDPSLGMTTFLKHWEMNDFLFLILIENLKQTGPARPDRTAWFSIMPESFRRVLHQQVVVHWGISPADVPFRVSRAVTGIVFFLVAVTLAWRLAPDASGDRFCELAFLTIAWFWLLCPTQNPWYWTWAMPLLPFVRGRAWVAVSGLVFLYYLRFWFGYHYPDPGQVPERGILGTDYSGHAFFDFVVTWVEFAPWFAFLWWDRHRIGSRTGRAEGSADGAHPDEASLQVDSAVNAL